MRKRLLRHVNGGGHCTQSKYFKFHSMSYKEPLQQPMNHSDKVWMTRKQKYP